VSHDETFDTLAVVYAVGALDGEERSRFETHLAEGCEICEVTLRESNETLAGLAGEAPPAIPPAHVKEALMRRVAEAMPARPALPSRRRWLAVAAVAVLTVSAFTAAYVAGRYAARLGQMAREMAALREHVRQEQTTLNQQLAVYRDIVELLRDPATRVVTLQGTGPAPGALARVVWNDRTGGHIFVSNLTPPPTGKAYELWTIGTGAPRPAGLVAVQPSGEASQRVAAVPAGDPVKVFAITIEPEGGTPAPTGPIILASK